MSSGKDWCASSLPRTFILYREICHTLFGYCSTSLTLFYLTLLFESYCYFSIPLLSSLCLLKKKVKDDFYVLVILGLWCSSCLYRPLSGWCGYCHSYHLHIFFLYFQSGPNFRIEPMPTWSADEHAGHYATIGCPSVTALSWWQTTLSVISAFSFLLLSDSTVC